MNGDGLTAAHIERVAGAMRQRLQHDAAWQRNWYADPPRWYMPSELIDQEHFYLMTLAGERVLLVHPQRVALIRALLPELPELTREHLGELGAQEAARWLRDNYA